MADSEVSSGISSFSMALQAGAAPDLTFVKTAKPIDRISVAPSSSVTITFARVGLFAQHPTSLFMSRAFSSRPCFWLQDSYTWLYSIRGCDICPYLRLFRLPCLVRKLRKTSSCDSTEFPRVKNTPDQSGLLNCVAAHAQLSRAIWLWEACMQQHILQLNTTL